MPSDEKSFYFNSSLRCFIEISFNNEVGVYIFLFLHISQRMDIAFNPKYCCSITFIPNKQFLKLIFTFTRFNNSLRNTEVTRGSKYNVRYQFAAWYASNSRVLSSGLFNKSGWFISSSTNMSITPEFHPYEWLKGAFTRSCNEVPRIQPCQWHPITFAGVSCIATRR